MYPENLQNLKTDLKRRKAQLIKRLNSESCEAGDDDSKNKYDQYYNEWNSGSKNAKKVLKATIRKFASYRTTDFEEADNVAVTKTTELLEAVIRDWHFTYSSMLAKSKRIPAFEIHNVISEALDFLLNVFIDLVKVAAKDIVEYPAKLEALINKLKRKKDMKASQFSEFN